MSRVLLRLPAVQSKTGLTAWEIYERQKRGEFPASVPLGKRTVAWVESEIDGWIAERIAARDALSPEHLRELRRHRAGPGRGHKEPIERETV